MTNSNQKERFQTKIAMLEQNNQVLQNKCEEYLGELIRTRKALDVAVDALDRMAIYDSIYDIIARNAMKRIKELEQITALEQKDHFADASKKVEQKE